MSRAKRSLRRWTQSRITYKAARAVVGILVLFIGAVPVSQVLAEEKSWVLHERTLPVPAAASDALREAIANTPQPDVAAHIRMTTFKTKEEWVKTIRAADAPKTPLIKARTERLKVTIKEEKIADVTARTVTPVDIDPANKDRLFVPTHGGAYVLGGGRAGLGEAILIAHRAKIPRAVH